MLIAHHFNGLKDDPALDRLKDPNPSPIKGNFEGNSEESSFHKAMQAVSYKENSKPRMVEISYQKENLSLVKDPSLAHNEPLKEDQVQDHLVTKDSALKKDKDHSSLKELENQAAKLLTQLKNLKTNANKELKEELGNILQQIQAMIQNLQNGSLSSGNKNANFNTDSLKATLAQVKDLLTNLSKDPNTIMSKDVLNPIQNQLKDFLANVSKDFKLELSKEQLESMINHKDSKKMNENAKSETTLSKPMGDVQDPSIQQKRVEYAQEVRQSQFQRNQLEAQLGNQNSNGVVGNAQANGNLKIQTGLNGQQNGSQSGQGQSHNAQNAGSFVGLEGFMQKLGTDQGSIFNLSTSEKVSLGREVLNQLGENLKGQIGKTQTQFSFTLNPQELGKVTVHLNMKEDVIKGQIVVESEVVKDLLKDRFKEMESLFQAQGINLDEIEIHTQSEYESQYGSQNFNEKEDLFNQYKEASEQVKWSRDGNFENSSSQYEKTIDNLYNDGEFLITI